MKRENPPGVGLGGDGEDPNCIEPNSPLIGGGTVDAKTGLITAAVVGAVLLGLILLFQ